MFDMIFEDFVRQIYLPYAKLRKKSWKFEAGICEKHLVPAFGKKRLKHIDGRAIDAWMQSMARKGYAAASINRYFSLLRAIFKLSCARNYLTASPCASVRFLRPKAPRETWLELNQARSLLAHLLAQSTPAAFALALLLVTGARKSEILRCQWQNAHLEDRFLLAPDSKSGRPRHILLSDIALEIIARLPRNGPWLFPNRKGDKPLADIYNGWDQIRKEMGLRNFRIHDLRHTFASHLARSGVSLYQIQKILGHESPASTQRYAHLANRDLLLAVNNAGQDFRGKEGKRGRNGN